MKRLAVVVAVAACSVGPKLVTVPMLESAPATERVATDTDAPTTGDEDTTNFAGTWDGRAWQVGNKSWPLSVTFERPHGPEVVAHVYYADQRCRGDWKLRSGEPRHWQGDESITTDPFRRCPDHGRVSVEIIDEETLNWRWTRGSDTATATLERTQH
jgi:hypothetical protein